jgi:LysM repeat protein
MATWQGLHRLTGTLGDGPLTVAGQPAGKVVTELETNLVTSQRVIVQPGDTLWSIARRVQPAGDLRPLVDKLDAQRHGRALQVGETIVLPAQR